MSPSPEQELFWYQRAIIIFVISSFEISGSYHLRTIINRLVPKESQTTVETIPVEVFNNPTTFTKYCKVPNETREKTKYTLPVIHRFAGMGPSAPIVDQLCLLTAGRVLVGTEDEEVLVESILAK